MNTKNISIEIPHALLPDTESIREKMRSLTEKKEEIFKQELEACGFYHGRRVRIICDEEGVHALPVTPYTPPEYIHHPNCRCTLE